MSAEDRDDAWLDAFDPAELDHPELDEVDASVDRVLRRLGRRPSEPAAPARSRLPLVVGALALAAGALLGAWWTTPPVRPSTAHVESPAPVPAAEPAPQPVPAPSAAPSSAPRPLPQVATSPPAPAPIAPTPLPEPVLAPLVEVPPPPAVAEAPMLPGLAPHRGAEVAVQGDAAVLVDGLLTWTHDDRHDPGVSYVAWRDLPLVVRPVGTAFTVGASTSLASISVREGHVRVEHADGSLLAALGPGQELTVVADLRSPLGLRMLATDDLPLDQVAALADRRCRCEPEDLVALVASLRLATLEAATPMGLPIELPEEP